MKAIIKPLNFQRETTLWRCLGISINLYAAPIFPVVQSSDLLNLHAKSFVLPLRKDS